MAGNAHAEQKQDEELEDIKKLDPQERIKRLKELEDARKKEIEEAETLIKETVRELEDAEERKKIPIPEAKATELSALETLEEKQIVATHHFLQTGTAEQHQSQQQQQKSLEEVAAEEAPKAGGQQPQFQKPEYAIGAEQRRSPFAEYVSGSQRTVTGAGMRADGSPIEERITEFYKDRAVTGAEAGDVQQKYFGMGEQVTGGEYARKGEEEGRKEQSKFYERRRGGPA